MTITAEQEARTLATEFDFQLQFWIGGQRADVTEENISSWATFDTDIHSTLAVAVGLNDVSFTLADGSAFYDSDFTDTGKRQTLFVEPLTASQAWERCTYTAKATNVFTGIVRDERLVSDAPTAYAHDVGTPVRQWVDVSRYIIHDLDVPWTRNSATARWSTRLQGILFNRVLFERGNTIICKARFYINGVWTSWMVWWSGYIKDTEIIHDFQSANIFTMNVEGVSQYLDLFESPAHKFGKQNIALDRPVVTSSVLTEPSLEPRGEFFATAELDGTKAVDGNIATPWVSQFAPRLTLSDDEDRLKSNNTGRFIISEIYFPPDILGTDYVWFEVFNTKYSTPDQYGTYNNPADPNDPKNGTLVLVVPGVSGDVLFDNYFCNKQTWHKPVFDGTSPDEVVAPEPFKNFMRVPSFMIPARGYVIFCRNQENFNEWWAVVSDAEVVEWRKHTNNADTEPFVLDRNGDFLQIRNYGYNHIVDEVFWGNIRTDTSDPYRSINDGVYALYVTGEGWYRREAHWPHRVGQDRDNYQENTSSPNSWWGNGMWNGIDAFNYPNAITEKNSIRRKYLTGWDTANPAGKFNYPAEWVIEDKPSPGLYYFLSPGEYASVDVGRIETILGQDLVPGDTTAYVQNGTLGFPLAGTFIADLEQITFAGKTGDTLLNLGTIIGSHAAGTNLYPVENGVVMRYMPTVEAEFLRPNGRPFPKKYAMFGSNLGSPQYPPVSDSQDTAIAPDEGDTEWAFDWDAILIQGVQNSASFHVAADVKPELTTINTIEDISSFPESGILLRRNTNGTTDEFPYSSKSVHTIYGLRVGHKYITKNEVMFSPYYDAPSSTIVQRFNTPLRYQHFMLIVYEMSDGGRVKVGEIEVYPRDLEHLGDSTMIDGTYLKDVVKHLLTGHFDLPSSKLSIPSGGDLVLRNLDLQRASLADVLDSMAKMTGNLVVYQLSNGIRWRKDPLFRHGYETDIQYVFDRTSCDSPVNLTMKQRSTVSQVEIYAENRQTRQSYHVYYPRTPRPYGRRLTIRGLQFLGNKMEAEAWAEFLFKKENLSTKILLRLKGIGDWCTPAQKIGLSYSDDNSEVPFFDHIRYYITTGVMWSVRASDPLKKSWTCDLVAEEAV